MAISQAYIGVSIVVLAVVAFLVFFVGRNREQNNLSPLASIAFGFILAGIFFGENRLLGYGLMGVGVVIAFLDILGKERTPPG